MTTNRALAQIAMLSEQYQSLKDGFPTRQAAIYYQYLLERLRVQVDQLSDDV